MLLSGIALYVELKQLFELLKKDSIFFLYCPQPELWGLVILGGFESVWGVFGNIFPVVFFFFAEVKFWRV